MKLQYLGLVGLGVICALCATLLVMFNRSAPAAVSDDVDVIVAGKDIEPMTKVTEEMCEVKKISRAQAPKSAIATMTKVVGQVITVKLVKGQPFTEAVFAPEGSGFYIASMLPPGKRAFPIAVADYSMLDGLLYPGSNVDVIASFDMRSKGDAKQGVLSKTLLRNITVLAIDNRTMASPLDEEQPKNIDANRRKVTLLVSPEQAEKLRLAMDFGSISLALRGPTDTAEDSSRVTRLEDIGLPPELLEGDSKMLAVRDVPQQPMAATPAQAPTPAPGTLPAGVFALTSEPQRPAVPAPREEPEEEIEYELPMWVTTVLRGGASSQNSFPIPGAEPVPVKKVKPKPVDKKTVEAARP
ncbi:MAG TPA: Flp pilus assembly protein CpaB [Phycisphaerales bacterium]|nr:Flp pilus assembly protein CpaB [Phycisphaerales bacterium]